VDFKGRSFVETIESFCKVLDLLLRQRSVKFDTAISYKESPFTKILFGIPLSFKNNL
jgi:hypothetical protein